MGLPPSAFLVPAGAPILAPAVPNAWQTCPLRRRQSQLNARPCSSIPCRISPTQLLPHAHTLAEFVNQLVVSCGVGLAGIFGNKATEQLRALTEGDRRADALESLASEIDSFRRRKELARSPGNRDWTDVAVDSLSNVVVEQPTVPALGARDELEAFDSLLETSDEQVLHASSNHDTVSSLNANTQLPQPSEFILDEDGDIEQPHNLNSNNSKKD